MIWCGNERQKHDKGGRGSMKKWYDEEYEWEIEVIGFNKDNQLCPVQDYGKTAGQRKLF